ncbi:hypothetical protein FOA52_001927 [Chlamydomonas sp. UWO 241]|nr:hypothetical protein FOA52_001927 [Chlamydomonas sp. UWO 241]
MALEKIPIDINAQPHQLQRHLSEVAPSRWPLAMSVASRGMVPQPPASSSGAGPSATAFAIASSAAEVVAEADSTVSAASDTSAETAVEEADSSTSDADATQGGTTAAAAPARAHAAEGGPDVHDAQAVDVGESPESPASV